MAAFIHMRSPFRFLFLLSALMLAVAATAAAPTKVFTLPVDDEIGSTTWRIVKSGLAEARRCNADIVVVHLNTYGGEVGAADSIRSALMRHPAPVVALVDKNAASAGALIALACDTVYMVPGASMGAATVVNGADGTAMPDKYQSYMRAMMRSTAESHGRRLPPDPLAGEWRRDPVVAEAMVDSRVAIPGLIDSTKVLTFTSDEAIRHGYAEGMADDIPDMLSKLGIDDYSIERYEPAWIDHLIGFLSNPALKAVLISLILIGIYWEVQIPGAGVPVTVSILAAILYFLPLFLEGGAMSPWIIVLFAAGVALIVLEVFVVPGFGVTGISGILCVAAALVWALAENISLDMPARPDGSAPVMAAVGRAILWFAGAVAAAIGFSVWLTSRRGPAVVKRISELTHSQDVSKGYIGVDMSLRRYIGKEGVASTPLRPSGRITIDGICLDAIAEHGFIDAGTTVVVTRHSGAQLYVVISQKS